MNFWSWEGPSRLLSKDEETKVQNFQAGCPVNSGFKYYLLLQMTAIINKISLGRKEVRGGTEEGSQSCLQTRETRNVEQKQLAIGPEAKAVLFRNR